MNIKVHCKEEKGIFISEIKGHYQFEIKAIINLSMHLRIIATVINIE